MSTNQLLDRTGAARAFAPSYPVEAERGRSRAKVTQGGLLAATDGTCGADAAVVIGRMLAERDGVEVELVTVLESVATLGVPAPAEAPEPSVAGLRAAELSQKRALWERIEEQRHRVAPEATRWPVTLEVDSPAQAITRVAQVKEHRLIIAGLGAHGARARYLGRETALRIIRRARVPVLAVAPHAPALPRTALVAIDFSPSSLRAAHAALGVVGASGTVYFAHVTPHGGRLQVAHAAWELSYETSVHTLFDTFERALAPPPGIATERIILRGEPASALLAFAEERGVELIAAGSHGYSAFRRALVGSVSTKIVRSARCSVLVAPPADS